MSLKFSPLILAFMLSACATVPQYTSGANYLDRYPSQALASSSSPSSIDASIRSIAAVEPDLRFPARIGLARINQHQLVGVPADEAESWAIAAESLGSDFGEFIPVSPLVAQMVAPRDSKNRGSVVDQIRRGAARQHLDYVISYEVTEKADSNSNTLRLADLTVLGLFVLPSRSVKAEATASAILLDVRNGYPYLTGSTFADKKSISSAVGSRGKKSDLKDKARLAVVSDISKEFADGLRELKLVADGVKLAERRAHHSAALN